MVDLTTWLAFAAVALGMVLTPGPNMIYLAQGRGAGLISLGGVALGFVFYMLCAAFEITALVLAVPYAYDALPIAGALYLWLAWDAVRPGGGSLFKRASCPPTARATGGKQNNERNYPYSRPQGHQARCFS